MRFLMDVLIAPNPGGDNHGSCTIATCGQACSTSAHDALRNALLQGLKSWLTWDARPVYK